MGHYMQIKELRSEGLTIRAIAQRVGVSRNRAQGAARRAPDEGRERAAPL